MGTKSAPGSTECGLNIGSILGIVFAVLLCCIAVVVCVYCRTRGASDDDATESEVLVVKTSDNDEVLVRKPSTTDVPLPPQMGQSNQKVIDDLTLRI
jgi:hypothetical protein